MNIGIKYVFSCINISWVPRELLKTETEGRGFQHLARELTNACAPKKHIRSLLLHKKLCRTYDGHKKLCSIPGPSQN